MEHPVDEIEAIIHTLTQAVPSKQTAAVETYFVPTAEFEHPFCATGTWTADLPVVGQLNSRWAILQIYQWYKILSPRIELEVERVTMNENELKLYVDIHQHFRLWFVPFYDADVRLTTVLDLVEGDETGPGSALLGPSDRLKKEKPYSYAARADPDREHGRLKTVYYISKQNDLYQTSEWIKFLMPWDIGHTLVCAWQLLATFFCILGAIFLFPLTWWKEKSVADWPQKI